MQNNFFESAKFIIDIADIYTKGVETAKEEYFEWRSLFRKITVVLLIICTGVVLIKYFIF